MKAKFKLDDEFRLKADHTFTRSFPMGGYNKDGTVGEIDQQPRRAGSTARISEINETSVDRAEPWYNLDFGEFQVHLTETKLLELFEAT